MFWDKSVPISELMQESSGPTIYICRFFGLFPLTTFKKQSQLYLKLSPLYVFYSFVLGTTLIIVTYAGLLEDTFAEKANSVRIKSNTEMYVTFCDITVVLLVGFYGIFVQTISIFKFFEYIKCLNEVDCVIPLTNVKSARNVSVLMIVAVLSISIIMLVSDQLTYLKSESDRISKGSIIARYLSFYIAYIVMLVSQYQFWHNTHCILRRLRELNKHLQTGLQNENNEDISNSSEVRFANARIGYVIDTLNRKNHQVSKVEPKMKSKKSNIVVLPPNMDFLKLASAFIYLCDATDFINQLMGPTNAVTIVGILWHLIESPFHALSELAGSRKNIQYVLMNAAWCLLHLGRLLMLVEPCHSCACEVQKTQNFVCKLLCSNAVSEEQKSELEIFATALVQSKLEFSAGGLKAINRTLVTAVLGTITTYLVILLQYQ